MVEIQPFRAMRYNPEFSGDVSLNVCPPFDVITPQLQHELYGRSRYNIVRLELARRGLAKDPYEKAAETAENWADSGVLTHENVPSIYVTEEEFIRGCLLDDEFVRLLNAGGVDPDEYDDD